MGRCSEIAAAGIEDVLISGGRNIRVLTRTRQQRLAWLAEARRQFRAILADSPRQACWSCGRYEQVSAAHHVYPLTHQWKDGVGEPNHAHTWLCPTHHDIVHRMIANLDAGGPVAAFDWMEVDERLRLEQVRDFYVAYRGGRRHV